MHWQAGDGSGAPPHYFPRQAGAPQKPLSELQEPEFFPRGAAAGWRPAGPGKTLHEEQLADDAGTQLRVHVGPC